jgi:hypothetical protein
MARLKLVIPQAGFEFEAIGDEEKIGKWCDEAVKMRFGSKAIETKRQRIARLIDECDDRNAGLKTDTGANES